MSEFKVGDRVRATLGENVLVGEAAAIFYSEDAPSDIDGLNIAIEGEVFYVRLAGWHIEKVSPPLPTKVGAIVRRADGELFVYDGSTDYPWLSLDGRGHGVQSDIVGGRFEVIFEGVDQ